MDGTRKPQVHIFEVWTRNFVSKPNSNAQKPPRMETRRGPMFGFWKKTTQNTPGFFLKVTWGCDGKRPPGFEPGATQKKNRKNYNSLSWPTNTDPPQCWKSTKKWNNGVAEFLNHTHTGMIFSPWQNWLFWGQMGEQFCLIKGHFGWGEGIGEGPAVDLSRFFVCVKKNCFFGEIVGKFSVLDFYGFFFAV